MPLIDVTCNDCGLNSEVNRPLAMYPDTPACPACGSSTTQYHALRGERFAANPVIVFRASDGTYRFPGDPNGIAAHAYSAQGYERVELRGAADVRRFEHVMEKHEHAKLARRVEIQHEQREINDRERSSRIRHGLEQGFAIPDVDSRGRRTGRTRIVRLSEHGKATLQRAVDKGHARPQPRTKDINFHVDAYSYDRSNREDSRDTQGRRRRD